MKLSINALRKEGSAIKLIRMNLKNPFSFLPGQSISINVHNLEKNIINQKRYYSLVSSPTQKDYLELLVKDNPTSLVAHYLYENLAVGEELDIEGPYGKLCLTQEHAPLTFIAGGSGIAPFISMIRYALSKNLSVPLTLFYSTKRIDEAAFYDELQELDKEHKLTYIHTLTQDPLWKGNKGRLTKDFLSQHLPVLQGFFFICGSQEMIKDTSRALKELGVQEEAIIIEKY